MNGEIWVLNKARGRALTCICVCIGLGIGEGRTQLTVNERRASVGDAPGDPRALACRPLACAAARAYSSRDAEGGKLAVRAHCGHPKPGLDLCNSLFGHAGCLADAGERKSVVTGE